MHEPVPIGFTGGSWSYQPALDGVRAVAVGLVLAFHADLGWLPGGFLGVSVFFTLSGFLITSLLLGERERTGRISLGGFWSRRVRRLAPASLACLLAVALLAPSLSDPVAVDSIRRDVVAGVFYVANWRFVFAEASYGELFAAPSPVLHMWSLAIEEQFYLLFPVLVAGLVFLGLRRRGVAWVLGAACAGSVVLTLVLSDRDRIYYGTDTRAAELLVGALMALGWAGFWRTRAERPRLARVVSWLGLFALVIVIVLSSASDTRSAWVYQGGLALFALASAAVVAGALVPGPAQRVLAWGPLPAIGRVSYGLYLYHWPVFVWLDESRVGVGGWALTAVRLAVTAAVTIVSYHLLECPLRERRAMPNVRLAAPSMAFAMGMVVFAAAVIPAPKEVDSSLVQVETTPQLLTPLAERPRSLPAPDEVPATDAPSVADVPVVVVLGSDPSLASDLAARDHVEIVDATRPPCPVFVTEDSTGAPRCEGFRTRWVADVAAVPGGPDAIVVGVDPALAGAMERLLALGPDSTEARFVTQELTAALDLLASFGRPAFIAGAGEQRLARLVEQLIGDDRGLGVRPLGRDELATVVEAAVAQHRLAAEGAAPPRVLVIGDSTSRNVAVGLARAADGWLEVISAGVLGCPLVRTESVMQAEGREWRTDDCPSHERGWPEAVVAFEPDVLLAVAGAVEQKDQRYPGIDGWQRPGTEAFREWHDAEMEALLTMLAPRGIPVLLLDAPDVGRRPGRTGAEPERQSEWNAQLLRWADTWQPVALVPYAHLLAPADSEVGRRERPDGIHPTDEVMERIAREHLVGALLVAYAEISALIDTTGCRVSDDDGRRFVLQRCRES